MTVSQSEMTRGVIHFIKIDGCILKSIDETISTQIGIISNHHVDLSAAGFGKIGLKGIFICVIEKLAS